MASGWAGRNHGAGWSAGLAILLSLGAPAAVAAPSRDPTVQVDIAAQPLASALEALAREAGIEVLFDRGLIGARQAIALHGRMPPEQALARLLAGRPDRAPASRLRKKSSTDSAV